MKGFEAGKLGKNDPVGNGGLEFLVPKRSDAGVTFVVVAVSDKVVVPKLVKLNPPDTACVDAGAARRLKLLVVVGAAKRNRPSFVVSFGAS